MKRGGRPKHESYQELAFIFKKVNEKCVAECMASHKVLQNTAKERFKTHLKYCIISEDENEDSVTNSIMEVDKTQSMAAAMSFSSISLDEVLLLNNNNLNPIEISKEVGKSKEDAANLVILVPPDTKAAKTAGKVVSAGSNIGKQRRIKSFMDYIDETGKRKFDYDLTNSLFASNIDPDVVESDYFKSFVKASEDDVLRKRDETRLKLPNKRLMSFSSESGPLREQSRKQSKTKSNPSPNHIQPKVRALKKLEYHKEEAERQQNQQILNKYMQRQESDNTILIGSDDDSFPNISKRRNAEENENNSSDEIIHLEENENNSSEFENDRRDLNHPSRRMSEPILTSEVTQRLTSRRQSAPERGAQSKNPAPRCIGPPLFGQRDSTPGTSARCIERSSDIHEDWIYLDENTHLHADIWETMKTYSDSRFVREVAVKLWGTEGLQQRCLDAKRANKGKENTPDEQRIPLTPEKYERVKDCLYIKLTEAGITGKQRNNRMRKVWSYLRSKIYDVRRRL